MWQPWHTSSGLRVRATIVSHRSSGVHRECTHSSRSYDNVKTRAIVDLDIVAWTGNTPNGSLYAGLPVVVFILLCRGFNCWTRLCMSSVDWIQNRLFNFWERSHAIIVRLFIVYHTPQRSLEPRVCNSLVSRCCVWLHIVCLNLFCRAWTPILLRLHEVCSAHSALVSSAIAAMGWFWLVGSLKLQVSFAKEPYKRDYILQKRLIILRSLLIVATP